MVKENTIKKEKIITEIKNYFMNYDNIIAVYLFGSFNTERFNKNSDVDLALIFSSDIDKLEAFDLKLKVAVELEDKFNLEFDIVNFAEADLSLKHQIIKGKLLKGKDNKLRVRKESKARREYLDNKYFRETYQKNIGKGFKDGW